MRKTNLFKMLVCTALIILVTGTTVMAGTVTRSQKVRGVTSYTNSYTGTAGFYCAAGDAEYARTTLVNKMDSKCYFECYVKRYNWITEKYDYKQSDTRAISNGDVMSLKIPRHKNATTYNYVHMTIGCTSSVYSAATAFDRYTFTAKQYYE